MALMLTIISPPTIAAKAYNLSIEKGYEALMTYWVNPELATKKFPGIEAIPRGSNPAASKAGFLPEQHANDVVFSPIRLESAIE